MTNYPKDLAIIHEEMDKNLINIIDIALKASPNYGNQRLTRQTKQIAVHNQIKQNFKHKLKDLNNENEKPTDFEEKLHQKR